MNKTSQWAGYLASIFSILTAIMLGVVFWMVSAPDWIRGAIYLCGFLAASSGVVCLASSVSSHIRK
jgi:hypothetical protein